MRVKAIRKGFFGGKIRPTGVEFAVDNESQLGSWMEVIKPKTKPVTVEKKAKKSKK